MQFREIKTSALKEKISKFIEEKFNVKLVPEKIIPVLHRSCTTDRVYFQDEIGAHYCSEYTLTELWKFRETMTLEKREFHVDNR